MFDKATLLCNVDPLILSALKEDITSEDVSTNSVVKGPVQGTADLICKEEGIICGLDVFARVFELMDPATKVELLKQDGDKVVPGEILATVTGDMRVILSGERTALNYLQRMSGIATYTNKTASLLEGTKTTTVITSPTEFSSRTTTSVPQAE